MFASTAHRVMLAGMSLTAAVTTVVAASPAAAAPNEGRQVAVRYADLNLTKPAGQRALALRVRHAVDQVCADAGPTVDGCRKFAEASAQPQIEMALAAVN